MSSTYHAAVEQTITAGEQIHQIVNGTATTEVTVEDGSKVPSVRKALLDNFYFKDPIAWQVGQTENVFNQLRQFTDGSWWYAPSATASNPISMGVTPVGNPLWKIYDFDAIGKLTPQLREALRRSYADAGFTLVGGSFESGGTLNNTNDVLLHKASGIAYSWGGALPKVVSAGSTPATSGGVGAGAWVDRTDLTFRSDLASESGSGLVGYQPAGTGAVATNVQSKLREFVSASDYNTLINAMAQGKNVRLLPGTNINSAGFTVPAGVQLIGEGNATITLSSGIVMSANTALKDINIVGGAFDAVTWVARDNVEVSGCTISGTTLSFKAIVASGANTRSRILRNKITSGGRAIDFVGSDSEIEYNLIDNCGNTDACILITGDVSASSKRISVSNNIITNSVGAKAHGIQIYGANADAVVTASFVFYVSDIIVADNRMGTLTGAGVWTSVAANIVISGNVMKNVTMEGIDFEGSKNCVAIGNTLINCGKNFGAMTCFHGAYNCSFIGNAIRFEGQNTAFTSGSSHTTTGPIGTSNRNSSSYWGYVRDDCTNILFEGNTISNDATSNLTEFTCWKGVSANHSTRGVQGLQLKNNNIVGGCIIIQQECDDVEITGNTMVQTFDTYMPIQALRCKNVRVKSNSIKYDGTSASSGINQACVRVGQFSTSPQRTTGVVIESNEIYGYPSTGITVDTFFSGSGNPDGSSFAIRGNKCANIYYNITNSQRIIELNYSPVTFAAITAVGS